MKFSRLTLVSASLLLIACLSACAVRYEEGQTSTAWSQQVQTINEEEAQKFTSQHSQKVVSKEVAESGGTSITFDDGTEYVHVSDTSVGEHFMLSYPSGCKVTYFIESGDFTVATDEYEGEDKASEAKGQVGQYFVESGYSIFLQMMAPSLLIYKEISLISMMARRKKEVLKMQKEVVMSIAC